MTQAFNIDCMEGMKQYPDKYFDLAIVDPPYGIGPDWKKRNKGKRHKTTSYNNLQIPSCEYFDELFRVSKNYIIWGYNYYTNKLGPTNYLICWDKMCGENDVIHYSQFELAATNIKRPAKISRIPWDGYRMGKETGIEKIHPHQKPIELYKWLLDKYAKQGDKILDTHLGSGSSRIASDKYGFDFIGFELDKDYFEAQEKRFKEYKSQATLF